MVTIQRVYGSEYLPVSLLYVDTIGDPYTFSNIRIQATDAAESLRLSGAVYAATFNGKAFPLSGADFLTAVVADLTVTISTRFPVGKYLLPFLNTIPAGTPAYGLGASGMVPYGLDGTLNLPLNANICVQSLNIPGVSLRPPSQGASGVPIASQQG